MCTASGFVTLDEALAFREQLLHDPDFDPTYSQLADLNAITGTDMTADQVRMVAEATIFLPGVRRALVGQSDLIFGLARMFEIVRSLRGEENIRVFHTRAEALTWLLAKDKAA